MDDQSRQCKNCRYFSIDFNRFIEREEFEDNEAGHCMAEPPKGKRLNELKTNEDGEVSIFDLMHIPPVVCEDCTCEKFAPRIEPEVKSPLK